MSDMQIRLGRSLLKSLVDLKEQKGKVSLEDVGGMFLQMASTINPDVSKADEFMHAEIRRLAAYIGDAKKEIFAISTNEKAEDALMDASQHLDEAIKAMEEASNTIMDAADAIQNAAAGVGGDKEKQIVDATTRIYDACTFQDITGQRITKVIKLLESIEERIGKLNALFGTDGDAPAVNGKADGILDDKDLLNGPQLKGQGVSQDDVDAMFASLSGKN